MMVASRTIEDDVVQDLDVLVEIDKLKLLYQHSFPAVFVSALAAVVMTAILWSVQDHSVLLAWFTIIMISTFGRIFLFFRFWRANPQGEDLLSWERPYFITLILSTLTWGVGSLFIMPADSYLYQAIIFCVLVGFSGGAFSYYSTHRAMTIVAIATILLPTTLWFLVMGDRLMVQLSLFALLFFLSAIRASKGFSTALHQNFMMTHELEASNLKAEKLARVDELTGLYNRRAFYENGIMFTGYCQRKNEKISVIVIDIDHFKDINDTFGHAAGDAVLENIGNIFRERLRKSDIAARIGGEEFGILLSTANVEVAEKLAEEIRQGIEESSIIFNEDSIKVTASIGVTSGDSDIETLINHADIAMYRAKKSGRNNVVCYESGAVRSA